MKRTLAWVGAFWFLTFASIGIVGCTQSGDEPIFAVTKWHDDEAGVTCWFYNGIDCLPDSEITVP